jgi:hypothetical protein|tara:strand:- start:40699 stop:40992 length:294 start_codon:yes stop_codon:yes gene_type:complete
MNKVITLMVFLGITMCSPPAYTAPLTKVYGPNCTTETTQIVQNGIIVSEIQTTTCKEETKMGHQKFDPDANATDALLYEAAQLMMYSVFVKVITEMN